MWPRLDCIYFEHPLLTMLHYALLQYSNCSKLVIKSRKSVKINQKTSNRKVNPFARLCKVEQCKDISTFLLTGWRFIIILSAGFPSPEPARTQRLVSFICGIIWKAKNEHSTNWQISFKDQKLLWNSKH